MVCFTQSLDYCMCKHHPTTVNSESEVLRRRGLQKWGEGMELHFPTDSSKFPTEEVMGAQKSNFAALNFPPKWGTFSHRFCILEENFQRQEENKTFRRDENFPRGYSLGRGRVSCAPPPLPERHW